MEETEATGIDAQEFHPEDEALSNAHMGIQISDREAAESARRAKERLAEVRKNIADQITADRIRDTLSKQKSTREVK